MKYTNKKSEEYKRIFIRFLKEKDCYSNYFEALETSREPLKSYNKRYIVNTFKSGLEPQFSNLFNMFIWEHTKEGFSYWANIWEDWIFKVTIVMKNEQK